MALRLTKPRWHAVIQRAIEDSGHDRHTLFDRLRAEQEESDSETPKDISREAFFTVMGECGIHLSNLS